MKFLRLLPPILLANIGMYLVGLVWPPEEPIGWALFVLGGTLAAVNAVRVYRQVRCLL